MRIQHHGQNKSHSGNNITELLSRNRDNIVFHLQGGPGTSDEMCDMFLNFYPLANLLVTWKTGPNEELLRILKTADR